ncbi:MAG: EamA family transporter [Actinomycetota bacterium]
MRARVLILFSGLCFATTGTAQALGPDSAPSMGVATVRLIVGAITLIVFSSVTTHGVGKSSRRYVSHVQWWVAGGAMALYGATFFAAVRSTGVAIGTVVALGSAPIFTGGLGYALRSITPTRKWILSTAGSIAGITLIVVTGTSSKVNVVGVVLALGAGFGYAAFALASKEIMSSGVRAEVAMARVFLISAFLMSPALMFVDNSWLFTARGVAIALWLGIVTIAIAYIAYSIGLRSLHANEATTLTLIEPVMATVLGALVLAERPSHLAWIGVALVLLSLGFGS